MSSSSADDPRLITIDRMALAVLVAWAGEEAPIDTHEYEAYEALRDALGEPTGEKPTQHQFRLALAVQAAELWEISDLLVEMMRDLDKGCLSRKSVGAGRTRHFHWIFQDRG
jgi:hypothetical protein